MLKVLRKYRGPAIAIGGSLLMIAFLVPEVVRQMQGDPLKAVIAEVNGRKVTMRELGEADREFSALKIFYEPFLINTLGVRDGTHWYLLAREAEQAGLVGQPSNGAAWVPSIAASALRDQFETARARGDFQTMFAMQNPDSAKAMLAQITESLGTRRQTAAGQTQMTLDQFDQTLAKARGIYEMRLGFMRAARVSDIAARNTVKAQADQAIVDVVTIPAERVAAQISEPTADELTAHFQQYQNAKPGTGLFGFGYILPPRFKLEYLKLDRAAIGSAVQLDPIEVSKHFAKNRAIYKGEFAAEKANVERDLRDAKVGEVLTDADRIVRAEISRTLRKLDSDGAYKKLPADWENQRPKFEAIAAAIVEAIKSTQKLTIPLPQVVIKGAEWLGADEITRLPDLGLAQVRLGSRGASIPELVLQTREIAGPSELGLQVGVPFFEAPIMDASMNRYYLTVLDARPEAPAQSLDEVRAAVVRDVKVQKAYLKLLGEVNAQLTLAAATGVKSVADFYNNQTGSDSTQQPLAPQTDISVSAGGRLPPELDAKEFRDAVLKAASTLDPLKPAPDQDPVARTVVVGIPARHAVAVAQITKLIPVTQESYRSLVENQTMQHQMDEFRSISADNPNKYPDPFSPESIAARLSYKDLRRNAREDAAPAKPAGS
jgi:hypothetical protein